MKINIEELKSKFRLLLSILDNEIKTEAENKLLKDNLHFLKIINHVIRNKHKFTEFDFHDSPDGSDSFNEFIINVSVEVYKHNSEEYEC